MLLQILFEIIVSKEKSVLNSFINFYSVLKNKKKSVFIGAINVLKVAEFGKKYKCYFMKAPCRRGSYKDEKSNSRESDTFF